MAGFLGSGDIYIDRDKQNKWLKLGNSTQFEIDETEGDEKIRYSRGKITYGQVLDRVVVPQGTKLAITLDEYDPATLAIALRGLVERVTSTGGTVTGETITAAVGYWIALDNKGVSNVVVKNETNTTTYEAGTDYDVNASLGLIYIKPGGGITNGQTLKVSYSYAPVANYLIRGSRMAEIEAAIRFDGINRVNGKKCIVTIPNAKLSPKSSVDFLADDFAKLELVGLAIKPDDWDEPYRIEYEG